MSLNDDLRMTAFATLQDLRVLSASASGHRTARSTAAIPASAIVAYARRRSATADLAIERALRQHTGARLLHALALEQVARASSLSVAAAADRVTVRSVGDWRVEILTEGDGFPWLVIHAPPEASAIALIELRRPDGSGRRLDLGQPVDGVFQLPLDPGFSELNGLIEWLQDPLTEIHLI